MLWSQDTSSRGDTKNILKRFQQNWHEEAQIVDVGAAVVGERAQIMSRPTEFL